MHGAFLAKTGRGSGGNSSVFGLIERLRKSAAPRVAVPSGTRVYAIGDVHGCLRQLDEILAIIAGDLASSTAKSYLVFIGDLIDRGPDSAGVIERLMSGALPCDRQIFIMGNHEEAMVEAWGGDTETLHGWLAYGGRETLQSYGIDRSETYRLGPEIIRRIREAVPPEHIRFIKSFQDKWRIGNYLFVHAGIRPGIPIDEQDCYDLRWIRSDFLDDAETDHGAVVVHGHTISSSPDVQTNRIGIDTGCYASGRLTALVLEGAKHRFLST
jgi:serine/threonine protein phosphatase 1